MPSETRPGGSCSGSLSGSSKMRLAIRMGSAVGKHEGRTAAIRGSRAPIQSAWKPPPLVPVIASRVAVHVVPREQVVDGPHAVPHHVAHEARAGDRREVAEHGVLAADEVVAAAPARPCPRTGCARPGRRGPSRGRRTRAARGARRSPGSRGAPCRPASGHRRRAPPASSRRARRARRRGPRRGCRAGSRRRASRSDSRPSGSSPVTRTLSGVFTPGSPPITPRALRRSSSCRAQQVGLGLHPREALLPQPRPSPTLARAGT